VSGPSPDTPKARRPIESKAQLIEELSSGNKPKSEWRIGTEHEKFAFLTDTLEPVPYDGPRSIKALLEGLRDRFDWQGVYEGEHIIALTDPKGLGNISLEPGGQFELSGAPLRTVHETCEEVHEHLTQVREIGDRLGIGFLGLGASPVWTRAETPVMPKGRYGIMAPYMDKVGKYGRDMMFRTCTVQVTSIFPPKPTWCRSSAYRWRCSPSPLHSSPIRRSWKASPTAISPSAPKSGATPTISAPACCPSPSSPA
jgi:glutamate--cysteine ligase